MYMTRCTECSRQLILVEYNVGGPSMARFISFTAPSRSHPGVALGMSFMDTPADPRLDGLCWEMSGAQPEQQISWNVLVAAPASFASAPCANSAAACTATQQPCKPP